MHFEVTVQQIQSSAHWRKRRRRQHDDKQKEAEHSSRRALCLFPGTDTTYGHILECQHATIFLLRVLHVLGSITNQALRQWSSQVCLRTTWAPAGLRSNPPRALTELSY